MSNLTPNMKDYRSTYNTYRYSVPEKYNMGSDIIDKQAEDKTKVALYYEDEDGNKGKYTFWELKEQSNKFANLLCESGIQRGDRVGVFLPNRFETTVANTGIFKAGAISVPLNILLGPEAVAHRLADSGTRLVVTEPRLRGVLPTGVGCLEKVIMLGDTTNGEISYEEGMGRQSRHFDSVKTAASDVAFILYTSGTTGQAKGVVHRHEYPIGQDPYILYNFDMHATDLFWFNGLWGWIGGILATFLAWRHGVATFAYNGKFDPEKTLDIIDRYPISVFWAAPTAWRMMMQLNRGIIDRYDLSSVRIPMGAGEALNPEIVEWGRNVFGIPIYEHYGQTEVHGIGDFRCTKKKPGSMGLPFPGLEFAILDKSAKRVKTGEVGEICLKVDKHIPHLFSEYWERPSATKEAFYEGGPEGARWYRSGDSAYMDEDGYFWFQGRIDEIISSAGYRISPFEIESNLLELQFIRECAVVGSPDSIRGEIVKAFIILKDNFAPSEALKNTIQVHVREKLAKYEYPREIEFVNTLPTTPTGKIRRSELKKRERERKGVK